MSAETFKTLCDAIVPLRSEEQMHQLTVSDYPHLKMDARRKVHKQIWKSANPFFKPHVVSAESFFGKPKVTDGE